MSASDCETIAQLSQSWLFSSLVSFKLLIALGGVAYLLRQWVEHGARFLGHINSRVLFHCYYLMFVVHGSSIAVMYVIDLTRVRFDCVLLDFWVVITLRGLVLSTLLSSHIIFILMSIERLYSALYPEERAVKLNCGHWYSSQVASTCFFVVWNATNGFQLSISKLVPIAFIRVPANAEKYDQIHYALCATNILSLLVFFVDIYLNFYPKDQSLCVSYQFGENRRVIQVLVPIEIVDSIFTLSTSLAQLLFAKYATDPFTRQIFLEATTFTHFHPLILAIIIKWRVGRRRVVVHPVANAIDHFKNLEAIWA